MVTMSADSTKVDRHYLSQLHLSMMNESYETRVDHRMLMMVMLLTMALMAMMKDD